MAEALFGGNQREQYRAGWASVAQAVAQGTGVARGGTRRIACDEGENGDHRLARPLQKAHGSMVGAGSVVLAG